MYVRYVSQKADDNLTQTNAFWGQQFALIDFQLKITYFADDDGSAGALRLLFFQIKLLSQSGLITHICAILSYFYYNKKRN